MVKESGKVGEESGMGGEVEWGRHVGQESRGGLWDRRVGSRVRQGCGRNEGVIAKYRGWEVWLSLVIC